MNCYNIYKESMGDTLNFEFLCDSMKEAWRKVEENAEKRVLLNLVRLLDKEYYEEYKKDYEQEKDMLILGSSFLDFFNDHKKMEIYSKTLLYDEIVNEIRKNISKEIEVNTLVALCRTLDEELYKEVCEEKPTPEERIEEFFKQFGKDENEVSE